MYALLPMAPPRLVPDIGIADTVGLAAGHDTGSFGGVVPFNPYAAMPSMHVGWSLLVGIFGFRALRGNALRWVFALHPVLMAVDRLRHRQPLLPRFRGGCRRGPHGPRGHPPVQPQGEVIPMATRLYRLGGWAFEHRWRVVAIWATVMVAVFASAAAFGGKTNDKFSVPGTESQQAQELLEQKYPAASGTYARLVFAAPEGEKLTDAENKAAVEASLAKASTAQDVSGVTSPYETKAITQDGRVGFADVIYPVPGRQDRRPGS